MLKTASKIIMAYRSLLPCRLVSPQTVAEKIAKTRANKVTQVPAGPKPCKPKERHLSPFPSPQPPEPDASRFCREIEDGGIRVHNLNAPFILRSQIEQGDAYR